MAKKDKKGFKLGEFSLKALSLAFALALVNDSKAQGPYYPDPAGDVRPLPEYKLYKNQLPKPVFDSKPEYIDFYYKAWEIGFDHFKQPQSSSPFISNFIDEAFNENIFLWDMSFSTMWGNYAHSIFPAIKGLDNFYVTQMADGEIVREIGEKDGHLGVVGWSEPGTEGNLNHPMLPWAELESYRITGDKKRLGSVYTPLVKYRDSFQKIYHEPSGLYLTDKAAMDDSPRNAKMLCGIDVASEMVIFDRWLAEIAGILGREDEAEKYIQRAESYAAFINTKLWDEKTGFYYDWSQSNSRMTMRTIAAFWTLLGKIPNEQQLDRLIEHLNDPGSFNTPHRVPTHPVDEEGFNGDYWAGAVWAPTNTMVIAGLEANGRFDLAHEIALNHLEATHSVYTKTNTAWENYHPLEAVEGRKAKPDFVGWSGLAPINYLITHAIGIRPNAGKNEITWRVNELGRHGIEGLQMGTGDGRWNEISLLAGHRDSQKDELSIQIECKHSFTLKVLKNNRKRTFEVNCSKSETIVL